MVVLELYRVRTREVFFGSCHATPTKSLSHMLGNDQGNGEGHHAHPEAEQPERTAAERRPRVRAEAPVAQPRQQIGDNGGAGRAHEREDDGQRTRHEGALG